MIGFNYFSLDWAGKTPKKALTILHIILQIIALFLLMTKQRWNWLGTQYPAELNLLNDHSETVIYISMMFFMSSIFIHLLNFFVPLFLKKN